MIFRSFGSSSKGNCYIVESHGAAPLLLECGIPIKKIRERLNFGLSGLAGCLVSHEHGDHSRSVPDLLKAGIDVFSSRVTAESLRVENHHRLSLISSGRQENIGEWIVYPFEVHHDVPTLGFLIGAPDGEKLLFIPDAAFVKNRFEGVNVIAIECNHLADFLSDNIQSGAIPQAVGRRVRRNHMSLETTISMLKANDLSKCREIWLLHLSDANSNEDEMRRLVQETTGIATYIAT